MAGSLLASVACKEDTISCNVWRSRILAILLHTLESGIDVGQGITVGSGKFIKKNKRRALNKRRA